MIKIRWLKPRSKNTWKNFVIYVKNLNVAYSVKVIAKSLSMKNVEKSFKTKDLLISKIFLPKSKSKSCACKMIDLNKCQTWPTYVKTVNQMLSSV